MSTIERLLALEEQFWLRGAEFYEQELSDDFLMMFPGIGVLSRDQAIAGVSDGQRWRAVEIQDPRLVELAAGAALLAYTAHAHRDEPQQRYTALVSSAYVRRDGHWRLAFHHQSPLTPSETSARTG